MNNFNTNDQMNLETIKNLVQNNIPDMRRSMKEIEYVLLLNIVVLGTIGTILVKLIRN